MATQISRLNLPGYGTLAEFYDNPPVGQIVTDNPGSESTAPLASKVPADERRLPQLIVQDTRMCQDITEKTRTSLGTVTTPVHNLGAAHAVAEMLLHTRTGDETMNIDVFTHAIGYVRAFVQIADDLGPADIQSVPCQEEGGVRPNRKIQRDGRDIIIIEHKSVAAFNGHASKIVGMAQENNGQGTKLELKSYETGERSIVFKVSELASGECPACMRIQKREISSDKMCHSWESI